MKKLVAILVCIIAFFLFIIPGVNASVVTYEWDEGGAGSGVNSLHVSTHGLTGPVLADDFNPAISGWVTEVDWWGSAPLVAGAPDLWEITFHNDAGGIPAITLPSGGINQHMVTSNGVDPDNDGVFFYSAMWNPMDVFLTAGTDYWFSVANASASPGTWTWANPGGVSPTVGTEQFDAVVSVGGSGPISGPHDGPWTSIDNQDFAFRIHVNAVPEPTTLLLFGLGLLGLSGVSRKK